MKTLVAILLATYGLKSFAEGIGAGGPPANAPSSSAEALQQVVESLHLGEDYTDEISAKWKKAPRGLYQIPTDNSLPRDGKTFQKSVCHSVHHKADFLPSTEPGLRETADTYTTKLGGCVYMAVLQEWRKSYCKADAPSGCKVSLGDVSHKFQEDFNNLKSHRDGKCFNFRPMRVGSYKDEVLDWRKNGTNDYNPEYDPEMTGKFIQLLREKGASRVTFNDPATFAKRWNGANNYINVCFDENDTAKKTCQNFKYDKAVCGEPGTF